MWVLRCGRYVGEGPNGEMLVIATGTHSWGVVGIGVAGSALHIDVSTNSMGSKEI
jgi:hypothetical protein